MVIEPLLTIKDVCELLQISKQTLYKIIHSGDLVPVRVGKRLRFRPDDIRRYLDQT